MYQQLQVPNVRKPILFRRKYKCPIYSARSYHANVHQVSGRLLTYRRTREFLMGRGGFTGVDPGIFPKRAEIWVWGTEVRSEV